MPRLSSHVDRRLGCLRQHLPDGGCRGHVARLKENLEAYLHLSPDNVWENSWVYFPEDRLSRFARRIFEEDLRADKRMPGSPLRRDADRFRCHRNGERHVRIPVSYLMKLALAEAVGDSRTDAMHSILLIGP